MDESGTPGVQLIEDAHDGGMVRVTHPRGAATIHLHGAHVTSWTPDGGSEQLWLSSQSEFGPGSAIRGGVPICFPWFAKGPGDWEPQHGFARRLPWQLHTWTQDDDGVTVRLRLTDADVPDTTPGRDQWPYRFEAEYMIMVSENTLALQLSITNTDSVVFPVGGALHTYLAVDDITTSQLHGLHEVSYQDKVDQGRVHDQQDVEVSFTGETDRLYATTNPVSVANGDSLTTVVNVDATHTVVWNPWQDKAAAMADFPDDGWRTMVCVEAAIPYDSAIEVSPGESCSFGQRVMRTSP